MKELLYANLFGILVCIFVPIDKPPTRYNEAKLETSSKIINTNHRQYPQRANNERQYPKDKVYT